MNFFQDPVWNTTDVDLIIDLALKEDIGPGDYSTLASIGPLKMGSAFMLFKENAVLCGLPLVAKILSKVDPSIEIELLKEEGQWIQKGEKVLFLKGSASSILSSERLILNFVQRLSGIATLSKHYAQMAKPYGVTILDTRKTTPGLRLLEKYAVRVGGASNHRTGLYDMVMLKDNHVDFCGGIENAIVKTNNYLQQNNLTLAIEIETRNIEEVKEVLRVGGVQRIMLDNFNPEEITQALSLINKKYETEASGGINNSNLMEYLKTGVDFISIGALTHSSKNIDISLKTNL